MQISLGGIVVSSIVLTLIFEWIAARKGEKLYYIGAVCSSVIPVGWLLISKDESEGLFYFSMTIFVGNAVSSLCKLFFKGAS